MTSQSGESGGINTRMIFWACFVALAATAAVFVVRNQVIGEWAAEFNLTETQKGEILGVGLWPFAVTIVLFSLVVDRIGYGHSLLFAFACHVASTVILLMAKGYWWLYVGTLLVSLGNGAAQAVVDPVVASMFTRDKTKWLNVLHASWPAGMVAAGIVGISIADMHWRWRIAMLLLPMVAYAAMVFRRKFPVHERVAAGVSYKEMLKETGGIGMLLVLLMMFGEVGRVLGWHWGLSVGLAVGISVAYTWYTRSLGQPLFLFLLVVMIPLATTELGTDSWITELMRGPMKELGANAAWLLVYTSAIMMILRFCAGPIVKALSPLGLLLASSAIASLGLIALSKSAGVTILLAATLYGVGKTYFWPTMLGIVAEIFPRGGALSLNVTSAVGMMSVGVVGTVFLGLVQDNAIESRLRQDQPGLHAKLVVEKQSVVGAYQAVAPERVKDLPGDQQQIVNDLTVQANKGALATVALLPAAMFLGYLGLVILFRLRGGYRVVQLTKPGDQEGTAPPPAPPRT
ncbi:MAG: multidrug resistance protein D [Planctomycetes bacterium ADurb.Bin126]|nr:MAG: multidrug resistance protein D [Planctomycetes bacterium ADurb.Bin126]